MVNFKSSGCWMTKGYISNYMEGDLSHLTERYKANPNLFTGYATFRRGKKRQQKRKRSWRLVNRDSTKDFGSSHLHERLNMSLRFRYNLNNYLSVWYLILGICTIDSWLYNNETFFGSLFMSRFFLYSRYSLLFGSCNFKHTVIQMFWLLVLI